MTDFMEFKIYCEKGTVLPHGKEGIAKGVQHYTMSPRVYDPNEGNDGAFKKADIPYDSSIMSGYLHVSRQSHDGLVLYTYQLAAALSEWAIKHYEGRDVTFGDMHCFLQYDRLPRHTRSYETFLLVVRDNTEPLDAL